MAQACPPSTCTRASASAMLSGPGRNCPALGLDGRYHGRALLVVMDQARAPAAMRRPRASCPGGSSSGASAWSTSNSLPSGPAMTTQLTVPWPMLTCRAPGASSRATSAPWSAGRRSRRSRFLTVLPAGTLRNTRPGAMPSSGLPSGGSRQNLVFLLPGTAPAQRGFPEAGDPGWVGGVNAQALDAYFHVALIVAHGSTNREAAAVFLSPKTVEILRSPGPSRLTGML